MVFSGPDRLFSNLALPGTPKVAEAFPLDGLRNHFDYLVENHSLGSWFGWHMSHLAFLNATPQMVDAQISAELTFKIWEMCQMVLESQKAHFCFPTQHLRMDEI